MRSDSDAQKMRPPMLNKLRRPAKPAAADGVTRPLKISWIIGDAMPSTPIPALTFRHKTAHSSQNCGVFDATFTGTARTACETPAASRGGVHPAGVQPGGGSR